MKDFLGKLTKSDPGCKSHKKKKTWFSRDDAILNNKKPYYLDI